MMTMMMDDDDEDDGGNIDTLFRSFNVIDMLTMMLMMILRPQWSTGVCGLVN